MLRNNLLFHLLITCLLNRDISQAMGNSSCSPFFQLFNFTSSLLHSLIGLINWRQHRISLKNLVYIPPCLSAVLHLRLLGLLLTFLLLIDIILWRCCIVEALFIHARTMTDQVNCIEFLVEFFVCCFICTLVLDRF